MFALGSGSANSGAIGTSLGPSMIIIINTLPSSLGFRAYGSGSRVHEGLRLIKSFCRDVGCLRQPWAVFKRFCGRAHGLDTCGLSRGRLIWRNTKASKCFLVWRS